MNLPTFKANQNEPFFLIAGPCVIESEEMALSTAAALREITDKLGIDFIYKSSFDKANRTSSDSPRGPGRNKGLAILGKVRERVEVPVLTDVHNVEDVADAAEVVDVLQTPAFLCRQTDLIQAAALSGKPVNIKKGQFLSPHEMQHVVDKAKSANREATIMVCERGSSFGYNNLVVDMRSLEIMKSTQCPVVFDATHSVQLPGAGQGHLTGKSGGQREFVPVLSKAAIAVGVDGIFMETHPDPANAFSDGPNAWPLDQMEALLKQLIAIDRITKSTRRKSI
ncbi:3-deoxy-8-phosphooctulonate synthase [Candidatus Spongiihabitans sp.]|uniref:3-deoxy-8-phosphooctulonate synthase n=1 Tax=Candidatus Spongiihabitans sp. TaxID=3101308 RepID=UPI003C7C6515